MAVNSTGIGYQFLPPVIRPDPNATSGSSADTSRTSTTGTASAPVAAPAVSASDTTVEHANTGKHLLRITV